jgi:hypothetical protein
MKCGFVYNVCDGHANRIEAPKKKEETNCDGKTENKMMFMVMIRSS